MNPLVTIGIPTYNRLDYLKEAVASALAQTYPNIEILISQNPYKDESITRSIRDWCQELVERNPNVRYQLHLKNIGSPANFNSISDVARGKYLATIGDDDRLLPNFVEKLVEAIEPDKNVAFSDPYYIDKNGNRLEKRSKRRSQECHRDRLSAGEVNAKIAAWQKSPQLEATLLRTQDFQRLRFKEDLGSPDNLLFILLAQEGGRFAFVPEHLSEIRIHDRRSIAAGLNIEMLVPHLLEISVEPEIEPYKQTRLAQLLTGAVSTYLLNGQIEEAQKYVGHAYYPRRSLKGSILRSIAMLPKGLVSRLYGSIYAIARYKKIRKRHTALQFSNLPMENDLPS